MQLTVLAHTVYTINLDTKFAHTDFIHTIYIVILDIGFAMNLSNISQNIERIKLQ